MLLKKSDKKTRPIRSRENGESGLCCLAMLISPLNKNITLNYLRKSYPNLRKGISLKSMLEILDIQGLNARAVHCPIDSIEELKLPAILHWNMGQFVVLTKISLGHYEIYNPCSKKISYTQKEFTDCYSSVAVEIK